MTTMSTGSRLQRSGRPYTRDIADCLRCAGDGEHRLALGAHGVALGFREQGPRARPVELDEVRAAAGEVQPPREWQRHRRLLQDDGV